MKKVDPRLRHVLRQRDQAFGYLAGSVAMTEAVVPTVEVLVRCDGKPSLDGLRANGLNVRTVVSDADTVISGDTTLDALETLRELPYVRKIDASRAMVAELDLSCVAVGARALQTAVPPVRGAETLIGIVDAGIDFTHPAFRDAEGKSRILFLWDQAAEPAPGGTVHYGREYTKPEIDATLGNGDPFIDVPHRDTGAHGTHVAGIAAGSEEASGGPRSGVAPDADLIVVSLSTEGKTLGRSVRAFEAFAYIVERAEGRPVAINMSQGMNGGGHSGETVLEAALEMLTNRPGVVIVKSAGNEQEIRIHAGGQLAPGQEVALQLEVFGNDRLDDVVEIWHSGGDDILVAVTPPGGLSTDFTAPGDDLEVTTAAGNRISIDSSVDADETGDTATTVILSRGNAAFIQPGLWLLRLRANAIMEGRYDAWVERTRRDVDGEQTRFTTVSNDPTRTISIPGTAKSIITVGSFVTRPDPTSAPLGQISNFSSRGPSRYGVRKPEIAAPGEFIVSARSSQTPAPEDPDWLHLRMKGTSMAAPHVTGAAALVLSARPELTCTQVKQVIMRSARRDGFAVSAPDDTWGAGMLDIVRALELARSAVFPKISSVVVNGSLVSWETDVDTTGAVRFHTHRRQLLLGRSTGSRADLVPGRQHSIDLAGLTAGSYFCEVLAFTADNWSAVQDNDRALHVVVVP